MDILGIFDHVEEDLDSLKERTIQGSCQWLLDRQTFQDWVSATSNKSGLLWLTGNPGSGKSTLASFIIALLKKRSFAGTCHYHFFLAGHQNKRTLSYMLRSVALQAALCDDAFYSQLIKLHQNTGINFAHQRVTIIWDKIFEGILFRQPSPDPLFWVIDGLDEADSPSELIKLLTKLRAARSINVLLVSRATRVLLTDIKAQLPTAMHEVIDAEDTLGDIRDYVQSSIKEILPNPDAQADVVQDILAKASGSFLWVRLALERIRDNWYTHEDLRAAITGLPAGMEAMYERKIENMAAQAPKPRAMATRILVWVACSFRPLEITELEAPLQPEFKNFVNLEYMIDEICGDFVVVNKSRATLIHETAQQFLLKKTSKLSIRVDETEAHEHIALVCMKFLSDSTKWRRVFATLQNDRQSNVLPFQSTAFNDYPLLSYALTFWTYHISLASVDSNKLLDTVLAFLEENCLLWIHGVAVLQKLRILTKAAQDLKKYVKRRAYSLAKRSPPSLTLARDGELRQWAYDIIRVVGLFGTNITENPSSIHKHAVPFCPKDSIISRTFLHIGTSTFSVSGISSNTWDDCLARLTMREDQTVSKVLYQDTFFVTLVGIDGTLIVWHSETCKEIRRFTHGEYVTCMTSSKTSNLVATAGFKTTRIWDITTGEQLYTPLFKERHQQVRTLAFGSEDREILIAYDDCSVRCFDLATGFERWVFSAKEKGSQDHNCPRYMAISPDLTKVAIVFRGRPVVVWKIQTISSVYDTPKRCILKEDIMRSTIEGDAWNDPEVALWHPDTDRLIIMYADTKVVDWNVRDDEQTQHDHLGARGIVLSPDGNLLLTSDVSGTISVWAVPRYQLTYQLKYDELVTDMSFAPDGTRFYDIRGTSCNVWEPDALIRSHDIDQDNLSSNCETITSEPVISSDDNSRVPITVIACDSSDSNYCCGKEDGTVTMYSSPGGQKIRKIISHASSTSIIKLAWSASEKYLASGDDSGRIIAKKLKKPSNVHEKWAVYPLFDRRITEAVDQLLFSPQEDLILIAGRNTTYIMSLETKKENCHNQFPDSIEGLWVNHPTAADILLRIDAKQVTQYLWKNLLPKGEPTSSSTSNLGLTELPQTVQQIVLVQRHWLVLEILTTD